MPQNQHLIGIAVFRKSSENPYRPLTDDVQTYIIVVSRFKASEAVFVRKSHICIDPETQYLQGACDFLQVRAAFLEGKNVRQKRLIAKVTTP